MRKLILIAGVISALVLTGFAEAKSSRGSGRGQPSAAPSVSADASPSVDPSAPPSGRPGDNPRGRHCRRHNPHKPRGNCPAKKSPAPSPTPSASPSITPTSSPVASAVTFSASKRRNGSDNPGRRCRRNSKRKGRGRCPSRRAPTPTPLDGSTSTAMQNG